MRSTRNILTPRPQAHPHHLLLHHLVHLSPPDTPPPSARPLSEQYIENFEKFYSKRITEYNNGALKESPEILAITKDMVQVGLKLEEKLTHINKSAMELKESAEDTMITALIIVTIIAMLLS